MKPSLSFRLDSGGISLQVKRLWPENLNFYVLHLSEKSILPQSAVLIINEKLKLPIYRDKAEQLEIYDYFYWIYETHVLRVNSKGFVYDIILEMQESGEKPKFDMSLFWAKQFGSRFTRNSFYPPDIDLEQMNLKLNFRTLPAKISLALKQKSEVSGTKASTLIGFFVPTKEENPKWDYDEPKIFSPEQQRRMQIGIDLEEIAILFYINAFQSINYKQIGWCRAPAPLPSSSWGALPDGLVFDPDAQIPEETLNWYPDVNPNHGVMEIKCTESFLTMDAYYYPQVYMEMICAETMWCDVVRFKKIQANINNKWIIQYRARVFRIFRHKPTEVVLITLLRYALNNKKNLQSVVHEDNRFVAFRKFLLDLCSNQPYKEIVSDDQFVELIKEYNAYQKI